VVLVELMKKSQSKTNVLSDRAMFMSSLERVLHVDPAQETPAKMGQMYQWSRGPRRMTMSELSGINYCNKFWCSSVTCQTLLKNILCTVVGHCAYRTVQRATTDRPDDVQ